MSWDPITRIIGNLGIHTKIDFDNREVVECKSTSSLFRGYSVFMRGKDPRDAHFITSRICGICGDNHATCSVYAQNMAYGIKMPPLAEWIYNLGEAAEYMFDHAIFQDNLVFVDFCEQMVKETNPSLLAKAERTPAPNARHPRLTRRSRTSCARSTRSPADLPRGAADEPAHARDVLPDGGAPRASVDAVSGRHGHGRDAAGLHRLPVAADALHRLRQAARPAQRRHLRLLLRRAAGLRGGRAPAHPAGLLGLVPEPRRVRLPLREHERAGAAPCT